GGRERPRKQENAQGHEWGGPGVPGGPGRAGGHAAGLGPPAPRWAPRRTRADRRYLMPSRVTAVARYAFGSATAVPAWRARARPTNASCTRSSASPPTDPVIA